MALFRAGVAFPLTLVTALVAGFGVSAIELEDRGSGSGAVAEEKVRALFRARPVGTPPSVDKELVEVQGAEVVETEQSYQIKAVSDALHARSASSQAYSAVMHVQLLDTKNALKKTTLQQALTQATNSAQMSAEHNTASQASLTAVKELSKGAVGEAKVLAVTEVQKALVNSYRNLESWRSKVLVNPVDKAKRAGAAAAEPYLRTIGQFQARIGQYQAESGNLMGQAHSAISQSDAIAGGAQGKMDSGDVMEARSDMQAAKALQLQGAQMGGAAQSLDAQVRDMNKIIPMYIVQAHQAAWMSEYKMNPDGLPPPQVDANVAFAPPPPLS